METIILALIASVISPTLLLYLTNRSRSEEKQEDWARQDEVARRVAEVKDTALEHKLDTDAKLEVIRTDVNSNMTRALEKIDRLEEQLKRAGMTPNSSPIDPDITNGE